MIHKSASIERSGLLARLELTFGMRRGSYVSTTLGLDQGAVLPFVGVIVTFALAPLQEISQISCDAKLLSLKISRH